MKTASKNKDNIFSGLQGHQDNSFGNFDNFNKSPSDMIESIRNPNSECDFSSIPDGEKIEIIMEAYNQKTITDAQVDKEYDKVKSDVNNTLDNSYQESNYYRYKANLGQDNGKYNGEVILEARKDTVNQQRLYYVEKNGQKEFISEQEYNKLLKQSIQNEKTQNYLNSEQRDANSSKDSKLRFLSYAAFFCLAPSYVVAIYLMYRLVKLAIQQSENASRASQQQMNNNQTLGSVSRVTSTQQYSRVMYTINKDMSELKDVINDEKGTKYTDKEKDVIIQKISDDVEVITKNSNDIDKMSEELYKNNPDIIDVEFTEVTPENVSMENVINVKQDGVTKEQIIGMEEKEGKMSYYTKDIDSNNKNPISFNEYKDLLKAGLENKALVDSKMEDKIEDQKCELLNVNDKKHGKEDVLLDDKNDRFNNVR